MSGTLEDFLLRMAATISAVGVIAAMLWFLIGPRVKGWVQGVAEGSKAAKQVAVETKPNGGNSLHDLSRRAAVASEEALLKAESAAYAATEARSHTSSLQTAVDFLRQNIAELINRADTVHEAVGELQSAGVKRDEAVALIRSTLDKWVSEDKIRAEAYRDALIELGIEIDINPRNPESRDRKGD